MNRHHPTHAPHRTCRIGTLVLTLSLLVCGAAISSADAQVRWQGIGILTSVSDCDFFAGSTFRTRYRAPLGTSTGEYRLGVLEARNAEGYRWRLDGNLLSLADGAAVGDGPVRFEATPRIRQISRSPDRLASTTLFVSLTLEIRNFEGVPGCNVVLSNALTLRPD